VRGKPFEIGNKAGKGRPAGSRNKKSKYLEILEEYAEPIIKKGALMALNGDRALLRACYDKLIPSAQPPIPRFRLPRKEGDLDVKKVLENVLKQTSTGRLSPQQAVDLAAFAETYARTVGNTGGAAAAVPNFVVTLEKIAA
jgi:hypothetical protein